MSVTNKGNGWEARNSLWLIWIFVMLFNWIAFFWIGGRTKQRKWVLFGCLYLVLCFVVPFIAVEVFKDNEIMENIFFGTFFIAWITSIIHAFLSRKEYLIRREAIVANQEAENYAYRQKIQQQQRYPQQFIPNPIPRQPMSGVQSQPGYPPQNYAPQPQSTQQITPPVQKIDLNNGSEQQLANLPGVGIVLAKKAIEIRMQIGGFVSVQDFNQRLGLMPHFAVQIENLALVMPLQPKTPPPESKGRVIDI